MMTMMKEKHEFTTPFTIAQMVDARSDKLFEPDPAQPGCLSVGLYMPLDMQHDGGI